MLAAVNRGFDRLVRPELGLLGARRSAFQVLGFLGFAVAAGATVALAASTGRSPWLALALAGGAVASFLALATASKLVLGRPRLVFYQHALAAGAVALAILVASGAPFAPYLDLLAIGLAVFLAFGRVGCLMVGCCHGAPSAYGPAYGHAHAVAGFEPSLVGVRLFPCQAIEAALAAAIAIAGAAALLAGVDAGEVAADAVVAYACARFALETARGDRFRPIIAGFSEARWTSLIAVVAMIAVEGGASRVHLAAGASLALVACFIAGWRFLGTVPRHRILDPAHVRDVALALGPAAAAAPVARTTSLGVRLSRSSYPSPAGAVDHIAISHRDGPLTEASARVLVDLVRMLRPPAIRHELVQRGAVVHLLLFR